MGQQKAHAGILPVNALIYVAVVRSASHFFHTRSQDVTSTMAQAICCRMLLLGNEVRSQSLMIFAIARKYELLFP